jgi:hypothetical protein
MSPLRLGSLLLLALLASPACAQPSDVKQRHAYDSRYLVFGTHTEAAPRLLAIDLNRTRRSADRVTYEYKLFTATGGDWTLRVYDQWDADPDTTARFPAHDGLRPIVTEEGHLQVEATLSDLSLRVRMASPVFAFTTEGSRFGTIQTAHPQYTVTWNGTTYEGRGVYEWVRGTDSNGKGTTEERAEARRQIDDEATFGQYDWLVLYDESGRLWHVSQGTLTQDFAYQRAVEDRPASTNDVLVRWLATAYDSTAQVPSPTHWLVDVPAWTMRMRLRSTGEHRGHGPQRSDGTRPVYVLGTVEGEGILLGEQTEVFGLVELIQD